MQKKSYTIENLDCANCAAKIERKLNELPEVQEATITFATRELCITAEEPDALLPRLEQIARTIEADATIVARERHHHTAHAHSHGDGCCCEHDHMHEHTHEHGNGCSCPHEHHEHHEHHAHECGCHEHGCDCHEHTHEHTHTHGDASNELREILLGAGLFVAGLILGAFGLNILRTVAFVGAYFVLGWEIVCKAVKNLKNGHALDENFLMSIASIGAFCIGEMSEGVGVMLFYRVGEYFEDVAMARSRSQIMDAVDLRPDTVNRLEEGVLHTIPAEEACVGDHLIVRAGDRIPLDGVIVEGESRLDTAPITGESVPVHVQTGDSVLSGCVNLHGQLTLRVEKLLSESMVTRILSSVENAAASKPKIDRFITRFARVYTPVVVALAVVIALVPSFVTGDWNYWVYTALSLLVMSCPCALVLSVPLAFFAGIGAGSKKGILFKGGVSMEAMSGIRAVVMDKTGTLTQGDFRVQEIVGDESILRLAASCEQRSSHPIAQSITAEVRARSLTLTAPEMLEELAGRGIRASVAGVQVLCGNARLMRESGIAFTEDTSCATVVYVATDGTYLGCIRISDTIKDGAQEALQVLKARGIHTVMLTGDNPETAQAVAKTLAIDEVHAKLLPEQKLEKLSEVRSAHGAVMFVGDGINDAPVLAGADVGAAMGSGADAAIEAADVVYLSNDVGAISESLAIAKQTNRTAWQNVVFALALKVLVMFLGIFGHASMWLAVFADSGVAMLCVLNSIRTLYSKK